MANFFKDRVKEGCGLLGGIGLVAGLTGLFAPAALASVAASIPAHPHGKVAAVGLGATWALANPLLLAAGSAFLVAIALSKD